MSEQQANDIEDASTGLAVDSLSIDTYLFTAGSVEGPAGIAAAEAVSTALNLASDTLQIVGGIIELKDARTKAQKTQAIENIVFGTVGIFLAAIPYSSFFTKITMIEKAGNDTFEALKAADKVVESAEKGVQDANRAAKAARKIKELTLIPHIANKAQKTLDEAEKLLANAQKEYTEIQKTLRILKKLNPVKVATVYVGIAIKTGVNLVRTGDLIGQTVQNNKSNIKNTINKIDTTIKKVFK